MKVELRKLTLSAQAEIRADDGVKVIRGVAIVYEQPTELWGFVEVISRGAATKTLKEAKSIRAFYEHDHTKILGDTINSSLRFAEKDEGVHFEIDLPNTSLGNDIFELVKRGDLRAMSFGFEAIKEEWLNPRAEKQLPLRTVKELRLHEVSIVAYPAYDQTSVSARSYFEDQGYEERSLDQLWPKPVVNIDVYEQELELLKMASR